MKEIKFRAWEKHAKRMLEIIGLEFENNELTAVRVKYPNGHRITPAYAGTTKPCQQPDSKREDHPRVCGNHFYYILCDAFR